MKSIIQCESAMALSFYKRFKVDVVTTYFDFILLKSIENSGSYFLFTNRLIFLRSIQNDNFFLTFHTGTSEIDQLYKIASILGTPGRNDWPDGYGLAGNMHFKFPTFKSTHLAQV